MKLAPSPTIGPSARFKDAFKIALAMVIAYAIALSQGWGTPFWAGFAVFFPAVTGVMAGPRRHCPSNCWLSAGWTNCCRMCGVSR